MYKCKNLTLVIVGFIIFSILFIGLSVEPTKAEEKKIYVDDDQRYPDEADGSQYNPYKYIHDAVNGAEDGDSIFVSPGSYTEDVVIDKSVKITTAGADRTFVRSGSTTPYIVEITADSVSIEGLTFIDSTTTSHRNAVIGISSGATGVKIINTFVNYSKMGYAFKIVDSNAAVLRNNTINSTHGILIENSHANSLYGHIVRTSTLFPALKITDSSGNKIGDNYFHNNSYGITLYDSDDNYITNNTIEYNTHEGI
jgi:parallel beta-helix repeat protein